MRLQQGAGRDTYPLTDELSWLERARKLVDYGREASAFINRASAQLPVRPADATAVARLWLEADRLDDMICSLLGEMNAGLIEGKGELDTTRGVSVRPTGPAEETVFYDCSWTLAWGDGRGVSVNLAIEPRSSIFEVQVHALKAAQSVRGAFPVNETDLKESLVSAYVTDAMLDMSG